MKKKILVGLMVAMMSAVAMSGCDEIKEINVKTVKESDEDDDKKDKEDDKDDDKDDDDDKKDKDKKDKDKKDDDDDDKKDDDDDDKKDDDDDDKKDDDDDKKDDDDDDDKKDDDDDDDKKDDDDNKKPDSSSGYSGSFQTIDGECCVDPDDLRFSVDGHVYTLGENTLQDMIDDGIKFDKDDISNANNNLNANYESQGFKIQLDEYYELQVYVMNNSSDNKPISECVLSQVYLPVNLEYDNSDIAFTFPLDLTEDELIAIAGEPSDEKNYTSDDGEYWTNTYEYEKPSKKYYGDYGYSLEFVKGELSYLYLNYK